MEQRLVNERVAAKYIGFSPVFLRKSRCEGNREGRTPAPPFVKIGRNVRYDLAELDRWINEHRREVG